MPVMVAIRSLFALLMVVGCAPQGRSQQTAPPTVSPQQIMASIKSPTDITPIRDGIRDGVLFRAASPVSEDVLRHKDGTPYKVTFTVPLIIDRVQNQLSVQALVNGRKIRLILDTGAPPVVSLNEATAHGIELAGKVPMQMLGVQGLAPTTLGLVNGLVLGNLTLQQIPVTISRNNAFYDCTLGLSVFQHYRITLDFAAKTMTLTRGGAPAPPPGGASLTLPFNNYNGYVFIPVHVLDQDGWAMFDSGADVTTVSLETLKAASAHLPPSDSKTVTVDRKTGIGDTARKTMFIGIKSPIPITINTASDAAEFGTTSWLGTSAIDDILSPALNAHMNAILGFPFLLQFRRVIIDYPSHTLILQYPADSSFAEVMSAPTNRDKPWPGYKWLQRGHAWIEVPNDKSAPFPSSQFTLPQPHVAQAMNTTVITTTTVVTKDGEATTTVVTKDGTTTATNTNGLRVIVSPPRNGSIIVSVNGTETVHPFPPGSTVKVTNEGGIIILPPGYAVRDEKDGSVTITQAK